MELFQDGWTFLILPIQSTLNEAKSKANKFFKVQIPHDWLIYDTKKLTSDLAETGWYRKVFYDKGENQRVILRFDGIYMDSAVYLNSRKVCEWKYGYTCFEADLTPYIVKGENELYVSVNYETPNSRWYSGAGIYRSVWMYKTAHQYIHSDGIYIVTKKTPAGYDVAVEAEINSKLPIILVHKIRHKNTRVVIQEWKSDTITGAMDSQTISARMNVKAPKQWDIKEPNLYELVTELSVQGQIADTAVTRFGFRTMEFVPDRGFFLNDNHLKIQGVCEHHDLGCLGAAFNKTAMKRRMKLLKEMGVNGIRISHNMPAAEVMELADEMGFLIVSELYDMWELPKNSKDYSRFFKDWYQKDIAAWVRRDRNCPSIMMWSIGNEIYDLHASERGQELTKMLIQEVHKHDPKENAKVTFASNYMPWENARKCGDIIKIVGYNYAEKYYEEHHHRYKDWVIYGSETASIVQSRGIYHFPMRQQILTDDDMQCSSLLNSSTSWGAKSITECISSEKNNTFSIGQFIWTGFDYIGEPTPYHTKNAYFGQLDTAGFKKDSFYMYQAAWTNGKESPMVHIFPYWDFNEGQLIDVIVCSNLPYIELLVNGESYGQVALGKDEQFFASYQLPYKKGEIIAIAYDETMNEVVRDIQTSFLDPEEIVLTADKYSCNADGLDLVFVTIQMKDIDGNFVKNANNRMTVSVSGAGRLVGLDNGDSTDLDEYKGISKRLFSGKLLAVIQTKFIEGEIKVRVSSPYIEEKELILAAVLTNPVKGISAIDENQVTKQKIGEKHNLDLPVRKIKLISMNGTKITKQRKAIQLKAVLYPENTIYKEVEWSVTNDAGIKTHLAKIENDNHNAVLHGIGDGDVRVKCMVKNGKSHVDIISQLEFQIEGLGEKNLDPYQLVSGGLYTYCKGETSNGNERGVATARDGETQISYENLDFGLYGSNLLTMYIFALTDEPYQIEVWEGIPAKSDSEKVGDFIYQKPSVWNVYQEETFHLEQRLKGITTITFILRQKIHFKGFHFQRQEKAWMKLYASEAECIYGDHFQSEGDMVYDIGNNVSLEFHDMDFGTKGTKKITICGNSSIIKNSIHISFQGQETKSKQLIEFTQTQYMQEKTFELNGITGKQKVTFLFLPGSKFDFSWFQFE